MTRSVRFKIYFSFLRADTVFYALFGSAEMNRETRTDLFVNDFKQAESLLFVTNLFSEFICFVVL